MITPPDGTLFQNINIMKAYTLKQNGPADNLVEQELPTPQIKDDQVLVKVKAISINPVDAFVRINAAGLERYIQPHNGDTIIIGWDIAGVVEETGKSVTQFRRGDAVFGLVNFPGHGKGYAEFVAANENDLSLKPDNISFEEAAGATLAALTAWQALVNFAHVKAGDHVLIHSAAGGVGHYAIQIAKNAGATVTAVASSKNRGFVLSLGADRFIDYTSERFEEIVRDVDIVLDSLDADSVTRSIQVLRRGGTLVSLLTFFDEQHNKLMSEKGINSHRLMVKSSGTDMQSIAKLLAEGKIKTHISKSYPFNSLREAHLQIETRRTVGKIAVTV